MDFQSKKINPNFKTIKDYPLQKGCFYIILFKDIMNAKVAPYHFTTRRAAERGLENHYDKVKQKYCRVLSYEEAHHFFLVYRLTEGVHHYKYDYSDKEESFNDKRNLRIRLRRRLRRMGLYTSVRASYSVRQGNKEPRIIDTPQKMVLNRKNPEARAISIEDEPGIYYLVMSRWLYKDGNDPEYAFKIKGLRFKTSNCRAKVVQIKIRRKAILIPYLLGEINNIVYETCEKRYSKVPDLWRTFFIRATCEPIKGRLSKGQKAAQKAIQRNMEKVGR